MLVLAFRRCNCCLKSALLFEQFLQQEGGVLVAGHAWGDFVAVGDVLADLYLEAEVVETVGLLLSQARELQVVGGHDAADGPPEHGAQEEQ